MALFKEGSALLPFYITSADLVAGTSQFLVSPMAGRIMEMEVVTQQVIVADTTDGLVSVKIGGVAVTDLQAAVMNTDAVGTVVNIATPKGSTTNFVAEGGAIEIVVDAIADGATPSGRVNGWLRLTGGN